MEPELQLEFSLAEGRKLRNIGMALAALPRSEQLATARQVAEEICRANGNVCIDEVREALQLEAGPSNGANWMGSVFRTRTFIWKGEIKYSTYTKNHARMIKLWELREKPDEL